MRGLALGVLVVVVALALGVVFVERSPVLDVEALDIPYGAPPVARPDTAIEIIGAGVTLAVGQRQTVCAIARIGPRVLLGTTALYLLGESDGRISMTRTVDVRAACYALLRPLNIDTRAVDLLEIELGFRGRVPLRST